jgi:hypothetical protein
MNSALQSGSLPNSPLACPEPRRVVSSLVFLQNSPRFSPFVFNRFRTEHPAKDAHPERPSGVEGFFSGFALSSLFAFRKSLVFYSLRTLPSSVSRKSFACHSYENCRVCTNNSHSGTLPNLRRSDAATFRCSDVRTVRCSDLLTCQRSSASPFDATLMKLPASVDSKQLTAELTLLDATLTKKQGVGVVIVNQLFSPDVKTFRRADVQTFRRLSESDSMRRFPKWQTGQT